MRTPRPPASVAALLPLPLPGSASLLEGQDPGGGSGLSLLSWAVAGILALAALYLLIRLIEWDRMNRDTPNQDDPFTEDTTERR